MNEVDQATTTDQWPDYYNHCVDKECLEQVVVVDRDAELGWCSSHKPPLSYLFK